MSKPGVYTSVTFSPDDIPEQAVPRKVLMCSPEYFDIIDEKNPHMAGNRGIDKAQAAAQWNNLKSIYQKLVQQGVLEAFLEIAGQPGREDMVFAANQTFPWLAANGEKQVLLSNMKHPSRQEEVPHYKAFFEQLGYTPLTIGREAVLEGMGDLIPHPGKRLVYGGYGQRTDLEALEKAATLLELPVVALELVNDRLYHLDTAFMPLDTQTAMVCHEAFTNNGLFALMNLFEDIISVPYREAVENFAMNAHCIADPVSGKKAAIIQQGSVYTTAMLKKYGYDVYEVDTSAFMQSGGSVFCLKMMLY